MPRCRQREPTEATSTTACDAREPPATQELAYEPKELRSLQFRQWAQVTGLWSTFDPSVLARLDAQHIWTAAFLESRLRWRERQPITVLELRVHSLAVPLELPPREEYWGCFSFVSLQDGAAEAAAAALASTTPALDDAAFAARQARAREALAGLAELQELNIPAAT